MLIRDWVIGFLLARRFAHLPGLDRVEVDSVSANNKEITFKKSAELLVDYPFSFFFDSARGHAVLSGKHEIYGDFVTCEVQRWLAGAPIAKMRGFVNGWLGNKPEDFNLDVEEVALQNGKLRLPASLKIGSSDWVVLVHGRTARRAETYRAFKILSDEGFTCLAISLRNNFESTTTKSRVSHFGVVEATDLAVAVDYARNRGARRVFVYAISMGAIATAEFLRSGGKLDGVILDSPALDWHQTLKHQANQAGVTDSQTEAGLKLVKSPIFSRLIGLLRGIDLKKVGFANWSQNFDLPILILHSTADNYVPIAPAVKLAIENPRWVRLVSFHHGRHVQLFNEDPERYRSTLISFLRKLTK